jgi:hypothetical protein
MSPARRAEDNATPFNWRNLLQALLLAGILWLIRSVNSQNEVLIDLKARFDSLTVNANQVPDLQKSYSRLDVRVSNDERRLDILESRTVRGGAP